MSKVTMWVGTETVRTQRVDLVVIGQAIGDMDDERLISMLTTIRSECQDNPAVQAAFANLYNVLEETKDSWA